MDEYIIAYMDILGYQTLHEKLQEQFKTKMDSFYESVKNRIDDCNRQLGTQFSFKFGSDSFLIFCKCCDQKNAKSLIVLCATIQLDCITNEIPISMRGGITSGLVQIEPYIFGDSYLETVKYESSDAKWGRIMVSDDYLRKYDLENSPSYAYKLCENEPPFIDYLGLCINNLKLDAKDLLKKHKKSVESQYLQVDINGATSPEQVKKLQKAADQH